MATIDDIKTRANLVKNETTVGGNTAERVGGVLVDLADHIGDVEDEIGVAPTIANGDANADLDIADENANVLVRFAGGNVQTKNFNSALAPSTGESQNSGVDFEINDSGEHSIVRFERGHVRTKYFDSSSINARVAALENEVVTGRVMVVRTSPSSGEYATLAAAMSGASEGDVIYMYEGTYAEVGIQYKRGVKVVGIGNVIIKGEMADSTAPATIAQYATIDAFEGCDIENVTITAKNCRYCIHSQTNAGAKPSTYRLLNVTLIHYGNQGAYEYQRDHAGGTITSVFRAISCWGCGLNGGDRIYMDGCKMIGRMRCWSVHNGVNQNTASNSTGACVGIMNNCDFISYGIDNDGSLLDYNDAIHIQHLASNTDDQMIFSNCRASGFVIGQLYNTTTPTIRTYIGGTRGLRLRFSTYGGVNNSMTDQRNTFADNATDWYPIIQEEIHALVNRGSVTIPKGCAVKKASLGGVALMTSADSASDFYGVALQEMSVGETGDVKTSGYIQQIYCNGIRKTNMSAGQTVYVNSDGTFTTSGSVAVMIHENQNLLIKE